MENYVLYDEIGRGEHSVVYKGRKKGTVEFVAIHCVEKCKRLELRNAVRITHDLEHPNVVKFHEWYETTNHIWMVVELCTGYSLDVIRSQDTNLPEETVKQFGREVIKGLYYLHSLGVLYCDLKPSKILLDGPGHLKLSDFALSCVEGEDDIFDLEDDADDAQISNDKRIPKPSPYYMAPEVLMGSPASKASDLWSFGCLLFELFTGRQPYAADSLEELAEKILGDRCPDINQVVDGKMISGSSSLRSLINGLLVKDPPQRLNWSDLIKHPFWENSFDGFLGVEAEDNGKELMSEQYDKSSRDIITEAAFEDVIEDNGPTTQESGSFERESNTRGIKPGTYTFQSKPHEVTRSKPVDSDEKNNRKPDDFYVKKNSEELRNGKQAIPKSQSDNQSRAMILKSNPSISTEREHTIVLSKKRQNSGKKENTVTSNSDKDLSLIHI